LAFSGIFIIDQNIKQLFLEGYVFENGCITLSLTLNPGVAFSMFASLGEYLKYIQIVLVIGIFVYLLKEKELLQENLIFIAILFGAGISNIVDRFIHGGVVDYIFWHCGFNFNAIFNFADIMIDFAVVMIILRGLIKKDANG
jgi:signal peptidase II